MVARSAMLRAITALALLLSFAAGGSDGNQYLIQDFCPGPVRVELTQMATLSGVATGHSNCSVMFAAPEGRVVTLSLSQIDLSADEHVWVHDGAHGVASSASLVVAASRGDTSTIVISNGRFLSVTLSSSSRRGGDTQSLMPPFTASLVPSIPRWLHPLQSEIVSSPCGSPIAITGSADSLVLQAANTSRQLSCECIACAIAGQGRVVTLHPLPGNTPTDVIRVTNPRGSDLATVRGAGSGSATVRVSEGATVSFEMCTGVAGPPVGSVLRRGAWLTVANDITSGMSGGEVRRPLSVARLGGAVAAVSAFERSRPAVDDRRGEAPIDAHQRPAAEQSFPQSLYSQIAPQHLVESDAHALSGQVALESVVHDPPPGMCRGPPAHFSNGRHNKPRSAPLSAG